MIINLILLILANYRLSRLIAIDDGPNDIMFQMRIWLGALDYDHQGEETTSLGRGIKCPHCVGLWVGIILAIIYTSVYHSLNYQYPFLVIFYTLAISGGQSFLWSLHERE